MKLYIKFSFIIIVLFASCKKSNNFEKFNNFEIVEKIIDFDSIYSDREKPLGDIYDIKIFEDVLILRNNSDVLFSFIDVKNRKLISTFGKKGKGPGEHISVSSVMSIVDSSLMFTDDQKKEINIIPIRDLLNDTCDKNIIKTKYPYLSEFRPLKIYPIQDFYVAAGCFSKGRIGLFDKNEKIFDNNTDFPFVYDELKGIYRGLTFQSLMGTNSTQKKIALTILGTEILEIYQLNDSILERVYISPDIDKPNLKESRGQYVNEDWISTLSNLSVNEAMITIGYASKNNEIDNDINEILCYDWDGNKIKKYILPFNVSRYCIDH